FFLVDRSEIDGRFGIKYDGHSSIGPESEPTSVAFLNGSFEINGCKGLPVNANLPGSFFHLTRPETASAGQVTEFLKWVELRDRTDAPENDFTLQNMFGGGTNGAALTPVLMQTPWLFKDSPPWHMSYMDKFLLDGQEIFKLFRDRLPMSSWLPFFYNDKKRTFFVLPTIGPRGQRGNDLAATTAPAIGNVRLYYPEIKKVFRQIEIFFEGLIQSWLDAQDFTALTQVQRNALDQFLFQAFPEQAPPPDPSGTP